MRPHVFLSALVPVLFILLRGTLTVLISSYGAAVTRASQQSVHPACIPRASRGRVLRQRPLRLGDTMGWQKKGRRALTCNAP